MKKLAIGIDVGGTFTDLVIHDLDTGELAIEKVATTPEDQSRGFINALNAAEVPLTAVNSLVHGSTIGTNAVLERKGVRCGLITSRGFRDVLELGRRTRPNNWGLTGEFEALIPRELRVEVNERMDANGNIVAPLDEEEFSQAVEHLLTHGIDALVVSFMHAYANPTHERRALELARLKWPVGSITLSSEILPEIREFERTSAAALNGYIAPLMARYLQRLVLELGERGLQHELLIMQGNGGMMSADFASEHAVQTVMSGPAAGAIAAAHIASQAGYPNILACDMGGTSFDLTLIRDGAPAYTTEKDMAYAVPLYVPMVDIHTIGAGGGSIAWIDASGLLKVGPHSAGSAPGPIAYGRGGDAPTVTDANVVLGRIDPLAVVGESALSIEEVKARLLETIGEPLGLSAEESAAAILAVANNEMANAARMVSIEKGHDPRDFALFAFGGGGPLHAFDIASELGIPAVLVPPYPGITSAIGCVLADVRHHYVRSIHVPIEEIDASALDAMLAEHERAGSELIASEGVEVSGVQVIHELDMLYRGQSHLFRVPIEGSFDAKQIAEQFASLYRQRFEIELPEMVPVVANLRSQVIGMRSANIDASNTSVEAAPQPAAHKSRQVWFDGQWHDTRIVKREHLTPGATLEGPAIIEQRDTHYSCASRMCCDR